jgi:hypothetical protein
MNIARHAGLMAGTAAGCFFALATVGMGIVGSSRVLIVLLMPGLLASMAFAGNLGFSLSVAALVNLVFWFLLFWLMGILIGKLLALRPSSH